VKAGRLSSCVIKAIKSTFSSSVYNSPSSLSPNEARLEPLRTLKYQDWTRRHSLRLYRSINKKSLTTINQTRRAQSILFIVFSPERGENTMHQALPRRDSHPFGTERANSKYLYQNSPLRNSDKISFSAFFATLR
jgi:hypothetical protein